MTIEEKAKAYDEAKARMSIAYNSNRCTIGFMNEIFPELKESEGERIMKGIKSILEHYKESGEVVCPYPFVSIDEAIAWLKKQGEQKPVISYDALREGITHFGITQYQIDNWLKKYVDVEKQVEQKPAWNEEDEKILNTIINDIQERHPEAMWKINAGSTVVVSTQYIIDWLKSLKDRVQPQTTWKPSDEQMRALNYMVNLMASSESPKENDYYYNVFKDLREQLKKLSEE